METYPKITVVTPSYNQGEFLEKTILSVLSQDYSNLQYIIMDGGSTDGSPEIIQRYQQYLSYWQSCPDNGQAWAIKAGFQRATGDILCWLNSDDMFTTNALKSVAMAFSRNDDIQCLTGNCFYIDERDNYLRSFYSQAQTYKDMLYAGMLNSQPATFWRKTLYENAGGISPSLQYCMDYDLFLRMTKIAGKMHVLNIPLAAFRRHPQAKGSNLQKICGQEKEQLKTEHGIALNFRKKILWRLKIKIWRQQIEINGVLHKQRDSRLWDQMIWQLLDTSKFSVPATKLL
jgi:glycosyltransferase involved in cell wall biosynthesis